MLAIVLVAALLSPAPAGAVAREIVELQQDVQQLIQGQKNLQTVVAQQSAVQKTLIELSLDSVSKLVSPRILLGIGGQQRDSDHRTVFPDQPVDLFGHVERVDQDRIGRLLERVGSGGLGFGLIPLAGLGFDYGPMFQGLRAAWRRGDQLFADVALPEGQESEAGSFANATAAAEPTCAGAATLGTTTAREARGLNDQ